MKRLVLTLIVVLLLLSCTKDKEPSQYITNSTSVHTEDFKVTEQDIEKVTNNFFDINTQLRANSNTNKILSIDSIKGNETGIRDFMSFNIKYPKNIFYVVNMLDGSTLLVSGDRRATPIYSYIPNTKLKVKDGKLLEQDKLPDNFRFMLGYMSSLVLSEINSADKINSGWKLEKSSNNKVICKPKIPVIWNQGYPLNFKSPPSNGLYNSKGRAAAGCVTIAVAQALSLYADDFNIFKGYELKTSWHRLIQNRTNFDFHNQDEIDDISNIIKIIAEHIDIHYNSDGSAGAHTIDGIDFLGKYINGSCSYDTNWSNIKDNMQYNSKGISIFAGNPQSKGWLWNVLGIDMPSLSGHCMLLDGFLEKDGKTLFYVNFGWGYGYNGYYFCGDNKSWDSNSPDKYVHFLEIYNFHLDTDFDDF